MAKFKPEEFEELRSAYSHKRKMAEKQPNNGEKDNFEANEKNGESKGKTTMNDSENDKKKDELYKWFVKELDKICHDLREELESHLDPDKGGDLLDEEFFKKILSKYDDKINKLLEKLSKKVNKIYDEKRKMYVKGDNAAANAKAVVGGAAVAIGTGVAVSTLAVTSTTLLGFTLWSSTLATIIGGATGMATGAVTAGIGAAAGVGAAVAIHKMGKHKRRVKLIERTMDEFENNRNRCLERAKEILERLEV